MSIGTALAAAPLPVYAVALSAAAIATLGGAFGGFRSLRRTRLMEDTPTARLRSAPQGYLEIEGRARLMPGPPIVSGLSGTQCVWFHDVVEYKASDERGRARWEKLRDETSTDCFLLDDTTGQCVVDPEGASVIPTVKRVWYGVSAAPSVGFEMGRGWLRALFCQYRYTEELILLLNPVYVLGNYRTQAAITEVFDESGDLRELLEKWKHDKRMMALLDVNKDGTVDQKEWEAARRMALEQVHRDHVERAAALPDLHVLARPRDGRPFIISGVPQAQLVRRYRLRAAAWLAFAAIAATALGWMLRVRGMI